MSKGSKSASWRRWLAQQKQARDRQTLPPSKPKKSKPCPPSFNHWEPRT